ncbi:hypothetical protein J6590_096659 [Homalodisca vitripennis]|nr:hypothetical protein J6590_096659 [Homalodisca vitripennis]
MSLYLLSTHSTIKVSVLLSPHLPSTRSTRTSFNNNSAFYCQYKFRLIILQEQILLRTVHLSSIRSKVTVTSTTENSDHKYKLLHNLTSAVSDLLVMQMQCVWVQETSTIFTVRLRAGAGEVNRSDLALYSTRQEQQIHARAHTHAHSFTRIVHVQPISGAMIFSRLRFISN